MELHYLILLLRMVTCKLLLKAIQKGRTEAFFLLNSNHSIPLIIEGHFFLWDCIPSIIPILCIYTLLLPLTRSAVMSIAQSMLCRNCQAHVHFGVWVKGSHLQSSVRTQSIPIDDLETGAGKNSGLLFRSSLA